MTHPNSTVTISSRYERPRLNHLWQVALFFILGMLAEKAAFAQPPSDSSRQYVTVSRDHRLDQLAKKQWEINKLSAFKSSSGKFKGYRIQVLNTNDRNLAYELRGKLLRSFPGQNVYMAYQAPNYKLRIGDFVKRPDAEKLKGQVEIVLGVTTYIVPDLVTVSAEEQARLLKEENP